MPAIDERLQPFALGELLGAHARSPRRLFGALLFERVMAARGQLRFTALQMEDVIGDIVEQVTPMADDEHRLAIVVQEIFELQHGLEIEMVGRLVEHEYIWRGEQEGDQSHAHPSPARNTLQRLCLNRLVETQPAQYARGAGGFRMGIHRI